MKSISTVSFLLIISLHLFSQSNQKTNDCICCETEFRQFDFWLGEWDVTQKGIQAGINTIFLSQDSCLMVENWTSSTSNYSGTSYNYYDKKSRMWHQTWVDNKGGSLRLKGVFENGKMILMDEASFNQKNKLQINKITWTPNEDGSVRQLWELTTDLGHTWTILFDGLYKPRQK